MARLDGVSVGVLDEQLRSVTIHVHVRPRTATVLDLRPWMPGWLAETGDRFCLEVAAFGIDPDQLSLTVIDVNDLPASDG